MPQFSLAEQRAMPSRRTRFPALILFLLLPLFAQHVRAQQTITLGQSIAPLYGPWKFHTGDNPAWASQDFDDSQWETIDLTPQQGSFDPIIGVSNYVPGWTVKSHPGYWGWAWYRLRVHTNAQPGQKLALTGPADVDDAYQVFANGKLLGSFGKFPASGGRPAVYNTQPRMFSLPQPGGTAGAATQVLAFRIWMEPSTLILSSDAGGMHAAPLLGEAGVVTAQYQLAWLGLVRAYSMSPTEAALFLLLALLSLSLILFDRTDTVYLWLAAVFLLTAVLEAILCFNAWTEWDDAVVNAALMDVLLRPLMLGGWTMVWWVWFQLRRPAWLPKLIAALTLLHILSNALGEEFFFTAVPHPVGVAFHYVSLGIRLLFLLLLVGIAVEGIRQQGWEGWLALPVVVLAGIAQFQNDLGVLHLRTVWFPFGVQVSLGTVANFLLLAAITALLLRRALLSVRRQREMALDVMQAQEVQQVLIPMALPQIPGLTIESEYRPAREVGGDFFQIVPHASDGSVLLVTGDVTGHGLQAGMLVALIVGAIRAEAAHSHDPLLMLESLNQRLLGRGAAHATALALRIAPDGACTLANAGHLPPYRNGKEIDMPGALPLGMIEGAEFSLMHFELDPGDTLLLLSDGVAEAIDPQGRLFGFDRIHALLKKNFSAAQIAAAAQSFGQNDDISVLRVERTLAAAPSVA